MQRIGDVEYIDCEVLTCDTSEAAGVVILTNLERLGDETSFDIVDGPFDSSGCIGCSVFVAAGSAA